MAIKIDLNIFTNCTEYNYKDDSLVASTFESWVKTFGKKYLNNINIFIDPAPNFQAAQDYFFALVKYFNGDRKLNAKFHQSNGLADAYIKSTFASETRYTFQLEHDWIFLPAIEHSIQSILSAMVNENIEHLRFSKRTNVDRPNGKETFTEVTVNNIPFCKNAQYRSNNPHIINRHSYLTKWNDHIDCSKPHTAYGVEHCLRTAIGYVYGPLNGGPYIKHLDGKQLYEERKN